MEIQATCGWDLLKEGMWGEEDPGSSIKEFPQWITRQKKWACKADRERFQNDMSHKPNGKRGWCVNTAGIHVRWGLKNPVSFSITVGIHWWAKQEVFGEVTKWSKVGVGRKWKRGEKMGLCYSFRACLQGGGSSSAKGRGKSLRVSDSSVDVQHEGLLGQQCP